MSFTTESHDDKKILTYLCIACVNEMERNFWVCIACVNEMERNFWVIRDDAIWDYYVITKQVDDLWDLNVNMIDIRNIARDLLRMVVKDNTITIPIPSQYTNETWLRATLKLDNTDEKLTNFRNQVRESLIQLLAHLEIVSSESDSFESDTDTAEDED